MSHASDPLHAESPAHLFWTTTNAGEAVPGVQTPLSLTIWQRAGSTGIDRAVRTMGVLAEHEPPPGPAVQAFYGRAAMSVDYLRLIGDRMPGATGPQVVRGLIGFVPDGITFTPTRRLHLNILRRFPAAFVRMPRELERLARAQDAWWQTAVFAVGDLNEEQARAFLAEALARHEHATIIQSTATFTAVQPVHDALERVIEKLGSEHSSLLTAPVGGAEIEVVTDIWRASRSTVTASEVVRKHGFHGPLEGELSSRVWRDDNEPLRKLIERYAERAQSDSPLLQAGKRSARRRAAERELLASAPTAARPAVRGLLALGRGRLHLRGVAKRSMLQGFDGIRAGARHLGEILAGDGRLETPEDVFYLTAAELRRPLPADVAELISERRARRQRYQAFELPTNFTGTPVPIPIERAGRDPGRRLITGIGVSSGSVEGIARVVTDPDFVDVEDGEVLVAPTTDPSWSSIMFVSAALIVDIGGALSHAAVIARELEIPCVVNTGDGTSAIGTGDRVRVDGRTGTVEILQKARRPAT